MNINNIKISNFKKIDSIDLEIGKINYLVGGNNAGKSSVLQAIHMAVSCAKFSVERGEAVVPESELRYSPTSEFSQLGHSSPYENKKTGSRGRIEFVGLTEDYNQVSYRIEIYKGRNYGNVGVERTGTYSGFGQLIVDSKTLFSVYVPGISGIPHREEYKSYASVFEKAAGGEANLVFRNVIRLLQERELLEQVSSIMQDLVGNFVIRLNHNTDSDTYLKVEVSLDNNKFVPLDLIGTGVLQLLQIISYVALFHPKILLVDEPDNHLHPSRQALLSKAFDRISKDYGATIIVSTHSRHLIASAPDDAKIIWMKEGVIESDNCRDLATVLMDLGALDQLDTKGAKCIICTEDKGKKIIQSALNNLNIQDSVKVISYNGISNASAAVAIKAMCDLLPDTPKLVIHRDRDFLKDDELEKWGTEYKKRGMSVFCPKYCDVEAYHCTVDHLSFIYELQKDIIKEKMDKKIKDKIGDFRSKFVEKRREANLKYWRDGGGPATRDLWPEDNPNWSYENLYGKDLLKLVNEIEILRRQQTKPMSVVSEEFKNELKKCLKSIDVL